ncbi:MAG: oligosaccharide flippase family protein [Calditrichaeota bacterium]|nr:oligosaccharide flippase family protein [Calditrichota bacterium]
MIPFMVVAQITAGASQAFKVLKHPALAPTFFPPIFLCLAFPMLVWWAGPLWSIAAAFVGSQVVSAAAAVFFLTRLVPVHRKTVKPPEAGLLRFSIPLVLAAVMIMLIHWSDIIMLGILTDSQTTGLYQPAVRTAGMMALFTSAFSAILAPIVSDLDARNERARIRDLLRLVGRWNFAITWPAFLFLFLYASKVILVFGADFLAVWKVLQVLALAQVVLSLGTSSALALVMTGYPKTALANNTITLVVNVLANLYLIPRYGPMGAALGTTAAIGTLTVLRLIELWVLHRMHPFTWKYTKPLLAGVAALAVCSLTNKVIFDWHTVAVLLVGAAVFVSVYVASLYLLRLDETDREVLAAVRRKLERGML